jgi:hypothetical protein
MQWRARRGLRHSRNIQISPPLWVNLVVLTMRRSLPVYPCQQTFSGSVIMAQRCHEQTCRVQTFEQAIISDVR